ncbi:indole-3-glycerol phosphate synthase TrpC [Bacillus thermotolerans]|uniref:Indole-3-glycerol phosphate synthase n=1 Tax=Bacillus thermotolerans TaxID=1221996 RepID=A0A0F5I065_BACTR|nr:indole-3-glycerol phosphate synthase TrpC [Bacillus thermotolerans]KKB39034.1 Indole-3-glycerol phosphate synthase [Bacillus thermotolerans]
MSTTILDKILAEKHKEVAELKQSFQAGKPVKRQDKGSLYDRFSRSGKMNVISEIKRASPSKGEINAGVDPVKQAIQYEASGADAISVLTDTPFFKGTMEDLMAVRQAVDVPVLCKDFIIDQIQITRAAAAGADVILLIAAALDQDQLRSLYRYAKEQQLDVLLEVHNEEEMERALAVDADVIGVNNRNLKTFMVDLGITERLLAAYYEPNKVFISESGMRTTEDVERVKQAGAKGILVGETFMRSTNIAETFQQLKTSL